MYICYMKHDETTIWFHSLCNNAKRTANQLFDTPLVAKRSIQATANTNATEGARRLRRANAGASARGREEEEEGDPNQPRRDGGQAVTADELSRIRCNRSTR